MYDLLLTDRALWHLTARLGVLVKITGSGFFSWNQAENRFMIFEGLRLTHWKATYNAGLLFYFVLMVFAWTRSFSDELSDEDNVSRRIGISVVFVAIIYLTAVKIILLITKCLMDNQAELVESFNQPIRTHNYLKLTFPHSQTSISKEAVQYNENLMIFICWFPLVLPFVFTLSFFHPSDPVHNLFEDVLELKVGLNWASASFACVEYWAALCFVNTAITAVLSPVVNMCLVHFWLMAAKPIAAEICIGSVPVEYKFETLRLSVLSEDKFIHLYRAQQCAMTLPNSFVQTTEFAFHSVGMLICMVGSAFSLLRGHHEFLDGSAMGVALVGLFVTACGLMIITYFMECSLIHSLEAQGKRARNGVLSLTGRKSAIYKTAVSFRPVTIRSGGKFFNVNKSSFIEWCDQGLNLLVNLLVTL